MKFSELIDKRKSTRSFTEKQIQEEDIIKCVEAARLAPSACNSQPWKFVIVRDREKKEMVAGAALSGLFTDAAGMNRLLREAGVIVALVNEKMKISARAGAVVKGTDYSLLDIGIAGEHFILQAAELGIGTCWVGWFNEKKVKQVLKVPKNLRIPCLIAMGYPKRDDETPKKRKPLDEIMSFDEY